MRNQADRGLAEFMADGGCATVAKTCKWAREARSWSSGSVHGFSVRIRGLVLSMTLNRTAGRVNKALVNALESTPSTIHQQAVPPFVSRAWVRFWNWVERSWTSRQYPGS
ncbi:hypothetical protein DMC64_18605 [Amycolatopsis sp. WAC 04197]|nr:hypothetical protein DMC64_18605 [Amycolatopsis sp. WAC 04197]